MENSGPVLFLQPFGISDRGGGAKILRSLLSDRSVDCLSVVTSIAPPRPTTVVPQIHVPNRPLARLHRTRLSRTLKSFDPIWHAWHRKSLSWLFYRYQPRVVHIVCQPGCDVDSISDLARGREIPFAVSFHDHPHFFVKQGNFSAAQISAAKNLWQLAAKRFVISSELGDQLSKEFGEREYTIVTDGVREFGTLKCLETNAEVTVYFMGLLHKFYEPNFNVLVQALDSIGQQTAIQFILRIRSSESPDLQSRPHARVELLPFADDAVVAADIEQADLTYLPLPFNGASRAFADYSLSTKMISYLASGRAIIYHGPPSAAAGRLLTRQQAAVCITNPGVDALASAILSVIRDRDHANNVALSGLKLAKDQFDASEIQRRFWNSLLDSCSNAHPGTSAGAKQRMRNEILGDVAVARPNVG